MGECDFADKQDALKKMVDYISRYKEIPEEFLSSVLKRENMANTSFGNQVAFPHPQELLTEDTFACVAISKKPLDWGGIANAKVRLILLASIEQGKNHNLQDFYKMISCIVNSEKNVDLMIHHPDYETLAEILSGEKR
jgi:lichenan operon transcriptional antiterminator